MRLVLILQHSIFSLFSHVGVSSFSVCCYVIEFDRHGSCIITDGQAGTQEAIDGQFLRDGKSSHDCKSLFSTQLDIRFQIQVSVFLSSFATDFLLQFAYDLLLDTRGDEL